MTATINQNYFDLNFDYSSSIKSLSIVNRVKQYILILTILYRQNKFFQNGIKDIDLFLFLFGANNAEKVDDILIRLEELTDHTTKLLESKHLKSWFFYPLRYAIDKTETSCMSLQALLASKEAIMAHNESN